MDELKSDAAQSRMRREAHEIQAEIAALEVVIKQGGKIFSALGSALQKCRAGNASWESIELLIADLPHKVARHEYLKTRKMEVDAQLAPPPRKNKSKKA